MGFISGYKNSDDPVARYTGARKTIVRTAIANTAQAYPSGAVVDGAKTIAKACSEVQTTFDLAHLGAHSVIEKVGVVDTGGKTPDLTLLFFSHDVFSDPNISLTNALAPSWDLIGDASSFLNAYCGKVDISAADFNTFGGFAIASVRPYESVWCRNVVTGGTIFMVPVLRAGLTWTTANSLFVSVAYRQMSSA